jgi:hypothetical protein
MGPDDILQKIANEVSGSICFEHVRYFSTLNREFGLSDHHQAPNMSSEAVLLSVFHERRSPPRRTLPHAFAGVGDEMAGKLLELYRRPHGVAKGLTASNKKDIIIICESILGE